MDNVHAQIIDRQPENARSFNRKPLKDLPKKKKNGLPYYQLCSLGHGLRDEHYSTYYLRYESKN